MIKAQDRCAITYGVLVEECYDNAAARAASKQVRRILADAIDYVIETEKKRKAKR